jgi:signal transduction histidine kinase/ligand-binding sensor domain-containing protein
MHESWQTAQGLPQESVLAIAQTTEGYIWLGTEEGLVRFDGIRFTTIDQNMLGLKSREISALAADRRGGLWIGSNGGGIAYYRDGQATAYTAESGLTHNSVLCLYRSDNGVIWAGTDGGGVLQFNAGTYRALGQKDGLSGNAVFSISGDKNGAVWLGTNTGLSKWMNGKFVPFPGQDQLAKKAIQALQVTRQGDIWAGTNDGLYRLTSSGLTRFSTRDGLASNTIFSIFSDTAGTLWVGTGAGQITRFVDGSFELSNGKEPSNASIRSILEDQEGNLWYGTSGAGLHCLKEGLFESETREDGLASELILPIFEDRRGTRWIGSDRGLMRFGNGSSKLFTTADGLPDNWVFSLAQDLEGDMWVGTRHGLARIAGDEVTKVSNSGLEAQFIAAIYVDSSGLVWIGTRAGLTRYDGTSFRTFTVADGLSSNHVLVLSQDSNGTLWIGTSGGGLNCLRQGRFQAYGTRDGLSNAVVRSLYAEPNGVLWIGTATGLDRMEKNRIASVNHAKGIRENSFFQILDDSLGNLWLSSNQGIWRVSKKDATNYLAGSSTYLPVESFDTKDGMKSRECNGGFQPAGWRAKNGRLYFPTIGGLVSVDPKAAGKPRPKPHVLVERLLVNGKDYSPENGISAPPGEGRLEIQFTSPTFQNPEKLVFSYKLEGFDRDWIQAGNRRTAFYTNIPPGQYRFRVRAGLGSSWTELNGQLELYLAPHYYQTSAFYLCCGLAVISLIAGAYILRVRNLKLSQQRLQRLVAEQTAALRSSEEQLRRSRDDLEIKVQERTRELIVTNQVLEAEIEIRKKIEEQLTIAKDQAEAASRAKSEFLTNMSHEIRTPINGILGMTDVALSTDLNNEQREYLELVRTSADSLLSIVSDILDFSRIEAGKLTLASIPFQLRKCITELTRPLQSRVDQKRLGFYQEIADNVPDDLIGDPYRLKQVLLNLLDNAIKFTKKGEIGIVVSLLRATDEFAELRFSVFDSGIGIPADKQKSIFEAFSQADSSSTRRYGGTGLGLTISHSLAEMMDGQLSVDSQEGVGSTFHFTAELARNRQSGIPEKNQVLAETLV